MVAAFRGLDAEGLLLYPEGPLLARVVAIPCADWTPEMIVGMAHGVPPQAQFGRRLSESGCQVMILMLIDRAQRNATKHERPGMVRQFLLPILPLLTDNLDGFKLLDSLLGYANPWED